MAEKRRMLDVWIVETNTVYKEVPFTVVGDWVQQGRLLPDDRLRPAGAGEWQPLQTLPDFAAYLPHPEPHRAEDQAEALEPVQMDFAWKRGSDDADEDVDMIPLIDVSLVLLVFFMMTATIAVVGPGINVPQADVSWLTNDPEILWIGIDRKSDGQPDYYIGRDRGGIIATDLDEKSVVTKLDSLIGEANSPIDVRISAHRSLPNGLVMKTGAQIQLLKKKQPKLRNILTEVRGTGA